MKETLTGFRFEILIEMNSFLALLAQVLSMAAETQAKNVERLQEERIREIKVEGDIMFGGLFPIHEAGTESDPCGPILETRGIQRSEAMLYALDRINADSEILGDVTIGALILDTCSQPAFALNQSLTFVRDLIGVMDVDEQYSCADKSSPKLTEPPQPVTGVIGAQSSSVSIQVANLLRLFGIVQISPAATAPDLSEKAKYEYFARTVPSDSFQAQAMADIANHFGWTYVSIVYTGDEYGQLGADAFKKAAGHQNICIAEDMKITHPNEFEGIVRDLIKHSSTNLKNHPETGAKVVILYTNRDDTTTLLREFSLQHKDKGASKVIWLASENWEMQDRTTKGAEEIADRALVLSIESQPVPDFEKYFLDLKPSRKEFKRNKWLREFWEHKHNCSLPSDPSQDPVTVKTHRRFHKNCSESLSLSTKGFDSKIQFVIDAVYALAHALDMMWKEVCQPPSRNHTLSRHRREANSSGICAPLADKLSKIGPSLYQTFLLNVTFTESVFRHAIGLHDLLGREKDVFKGLRRHPLVDCPQMTVVKGSKLYKKMVDNVRFKSISGKKFKFDGRGDGPAHYSIMQYGKEENWTYKGIGSWRDGLLEIEEGVVAWSNTTVPISRCASLCDLGHVKTGIKSGGDACCWACVKCQEHQYIANETTCEDCKQGWWPFQNRSGCYNMAETELKHMKWNTIYSIVPAILASFGILLTLTVISVYAKHNETPVVKASGRELSYILLGGMILCYLMTFVLLSKPTPLLCGLKRVGVGLGFAILYAAMLVKTNRIYRIFSSARRSAARPIFISPISQVVITGVLGGVQLAGSLVWMILVPPGIRHDYPSTAEVVLKCQVEDIWFLVSLCYDGLLILTCTIYAIKTRKVPENFNEAKFIGFTMYTTCIIWLAFLPIYFGTGSDFQIQTTTLCISISLSATVALFCLYSPKLWIILMEPEKNVRKAGGGTMMGTKQPTSDSPSIYSPLLSTSINKPSTQPPVVLNNEKNQVENRRRRTMGGEKESLESLTSL